MVAVLFGAGCTSMAMPSSASAQPMASAAAPAAPAPLRALLPDARRFGTARLTIWGFQVYDAVLWVGDGFQATAWAQQPLALELRYLRDFEGAAIARRSIDEMRRSGPIDAALSDRWLQAMQAVFPDVKKGDRLLGVYEPGTGARFFHNDRPAGAVRDPAFAERFFAIWLGAQTSEPAMRDALLAR